MTTIATAEDCGERCDIATASPASEQIRLPAVTGMGERLNRPQAAAATASVAYQLPWPAANSVTASATITARPAQGTGSLPGSASPTTRPASTTNSSIQAATVPGPASSRATAG